MDYTQLVNDFVEGNLNVEQEDQFFLALASNDALRSEFKQVTVIESALMKDAKSLHPSSVVTSALFARLGFEGPAGIPSVPQKQGFMEKASEFYNKFSQAIISGITTATACAIIFMTFTNTETNAIANNNDFNFKAKPLVNKSETINFDLAKPRVDNNIPVVSATEINRTDQKRTRPQRAPHFINVPKFDNDESSMAATNDNYQTNDESAKTNMDLMIQRENISNRALSAFGSNSIHEEAFPANDMFILDEMNSKKLGWQLEMGFNHLDIMSGASQGGFGLPEIFTASYSLDNNWAISIDLRNDNFRLQYDHTSYLDGTTITKIESPDIWSFGLGARVKLWDTEMIDPYAQTLFSFSELGIIPRVKIGADITPFASLGDVKFNFGVEYGNLFYSQQGESYNAGKFSITTGISYNL